MEWDAGPQEAGWTIPDEIEDPDAGQIEGTDIDSEGLGADVEDWMMAYGRTELQEVLNREDVSDFEGAFHENTSTILQRLRGSSLRGAVLTAMIGIAAGGAVKAKDAAYNIAVGPETGIELVDKAVQAVEGKTTKRTVEAMDAQFDAAAAHLRSSESLQEEFSPEDIEHMASALESFSSQDYFTFIADQAQIDVDDVARACTLEGIHVYSGDSITQTQFSEMVRMQADLNQADVIQHIEAIDELAATAQSDGGFYFEGHIFINGSMIAETGVDPTLGLQNLLSHELAHAFPGGHVSGGHIVEHASVRPWKEGLVEMVGNEYVAHWNRTDTAQADALSGYTNGPLAGAEMLSAALGEDNYLLYQAHVFGDWDPVGQALEQQYDLPPGWLAERMAYDVTSDVSPERFQSNIETTRDLNQHIEFTNVRAQREAMQPLVVMAELAYDHPEIADRANADLSEGAGQISLISQEGVRGVALAHPWTETGFITGLVSVDTGDGGEVQVMLSPNVKDKPAVDVQTPDGTVHIDFNFSKRYGDKSLHEATPEELAGALDQVIDFDES